MVVEWVDYLELTMVSMLAVMKVAVRAVSMADWMEHYLVALWDNQ